MSNIQFAFIKKENVPAINDWQKAIDDLSFQIRLGIDPELEPFENEGFSPCQWGESDDDVGFKISCAPAEDVISGVQDLKRIAGENDYCISMCWRGNMKDAAAVMIASCALVKEFGAVVTYEGEPPEELDKLIEQTREIVIAADEEESASPETIDYAAIAQDILQSVKENFVPAHQFLQVDSQDFEGFENLDMDFYANLQAKLRSMGFDSLCDVEDRTISECGGIKTIIRTMRNPESETLAAFYYVSVLDTGFFELESFISDGSVVLSTTIPESEEIADWPNIYTYRHQIGVDEEEMYKSHLEMVRQTSNRGSGIYPLEIKSFNELVDKLNYLNRHKHDHLRNIGWVTREFLLAQTDGDEVVANGLFEAIQKLVAHDSQR